MMLKKFLEPTEEAGKGHENSIAFRLWNGKSIRFVAVVTTLKGFKVWTQRRSKGKPLKRTMVISMLILHTDLSHLALHTEK